MEGLVNTRLDFVLGDPRITEWEFHVLTDSHVGVEGVTLKDHGNVTVLGLFTRNFTIANVDRAGRNVLETGENTQCGCFATAGRPEKN